MKLNANIPSLRLYLETITAFSEYEAVATHYGERRAERSQVPLIHHIREGIVIIGALGRFLPDGSWFDDLAATAGYCLHPLFQNEDDLVKHGLRYAHSTKLPTAGPVMLTMEYRWRANNWLASKVTRHYVGTERDKNALLEMRLDGGPDAGSLPEVRAMLIADKVQNYKDFLIHHYGHHARSEELDVYFRTWLEHLGVDTETFEELCDLATEVTAS